MIFNKIKVYGIAGGLEKSAEFTAHISASDCTKLIDAERLISAAPDLLAALELMVKIWEGPPELAAIKFAQAVIDARSAIKKSKG